MFYPVDSLKRGGRFYLCWVADSWPLRFSAITHRQLWSQDIRKLCDDLLEVMTNESGRPTHRFSLRLSSQLMRGLVRLYERKVTVLLGDLCMINAHVFKSTNKKFVHHEVHDRPLRPLPQLPAPVTMVHEEPEEQRLEEMIQNSGNVVTNIQDITLKEAVIPDFRLPPNDGFGEEHPDQPLQSLLADRTIEMMMQETSGAQISGLDMQADKSDDKSHDKSRPAHEAPQMEPIPELDITFKKSIAEELLPAFEKDVPEISEILDLPPPAPVSFAPEVVLEEQIQEVPQPEPPKDIPVETPIVPEQSKETQPENIELEELEDQPQAKRRRLRTKLIIDKKIKLGSEFLRTRIGNPSVELRCEDFTDDIVVVRVPFEMLLRRCSTGGARLRPVLADKLARMFLRNLGLSTCVPLADRQAAEQDLELEKLRQRRPRSTLERIAEIDEPEQHLQMPIVEPELDHSRRVTTAVEDIINVTAPNITKDALNVTTEALNVTTEALNVTEVPNVREQDVNTQLMDIADLPTQKLETLSQVARKRTAEFESPPKRQRSIGYMSFRESQQQKNLPHPNIIISEPDKENIPPNILEPEPPAPRDTVRRVSTMLQEAGLCDIQQYPTEVQPQLQQTEETQKTRRHESEDSETPLGSLDRTKVSLGDSVTTTDSQRFIRNQWGIEGTMMKIMRAVKAGGDITVHSLLRKGPVMPGYRSIIAARCFTSILKLKQHGFIRVKKDLESLEITDITLGARFDTL